MSDVFISYSRKDIAFARLLHKALEEKGLETWIDWQDIPPSADWLAEVYEAIEQADAFIFIISETSLKSEICTFEIAHANKHNKRLIPIVIKDIEAGKVPKELSALNWIFFAEKGAKFQKAAEDLHTAVTVDQEWVKSHTRFQNRALQWERKQMDRGLLLRGSALTEAEAWLGNSADKDPQPTALQTRFILGSREDTTRRQRLTLGAVALGLAVSLVLGVFAWIQRNTALSEGFARATAQSVAETEAGLRATQQAIAEEQRDIAIEQRNLVLSRQLAAQSLTEYDEHFDLALLLSLEANRGVENAYWAQSSTLQILQSSPHLRAILRGHTDDVTSVAASPTAPLIATASGDSTIILWDISDPASPESIGEPLTKHSSAVLSIAISNEGDLLASADADRRIYLWDISDPSITRLVGSLIRVHTDKINSIAISPDRTLLASASDDGTIILWDISDLNNISAIGDPLSWRWGPVIKVTFSPDGNLLAPIIFSKFEQSIFLWDISNPLSPRLLQNEETSQADALAFTLDGAILAARKFNGEISLWDARNPSALSFISHVSISNENQQLKPDLAINPQGDLLAATNVDNTITLFDISDPTVPEIVETQLTGHSANTTAISFSHDGDLLVSASWDNTAMIWDTSGNPLPDFLGWSLPVGENLLEAAIELVRSGDTSDILASAEASLIVYNNTFNAFDYSQNQIAVSPDESLLAVGEINGSITLWDISDPSNAEKVEISLNEHKTGVNAVAISPDGQLMASGSGDGAVILWDISNRDQPKPIGLPLEGSNSGIMELLFSPDGKLLSSCSNSGMVLWDVSDLERTRPLRQLVDGVAFHASFSSDGEILAISAYDTEDDLNTSFFLWDISDPASVEQVVKHTMPEQSSERITVYSLAFSRDGQYIAAGSTDGSIRFWDVSNPENIFQLGQAFGGHSGAIITLSFNPAGNLLAAGSLDHTISLWEVSDPKVPYPVGLPLSGHQDGVQSITFFHNGNNLVSRDVDFKINIWTTDFDEIRSYACKLIGRNLLENEWQQYLPEGLAYEQTCD